MKTYLDSKAIPLVAYWQLADGREENNEKLMKDW
ncbi:hypothetical protein ABIB80_004477 [Bradyrhizobium sp. i1.15.2]